MCLSDTYGFFCEAGKPLGLAGKTVPKISPFIGKSVGKSSPFAAGGKPSPRPRGRPRGKLVLQTSQLLQIGVANVAAVASGGVFKGSAPRKQMPQCTGKDDNRGICTI